MVSILKYTLMAAFSSSSLYHANLARINTKPTYQTDVFDQSGRSLKILLGGALGIVFVPIYPINCLIGCIDYVEERS